jgi:hypothetical protein
MADSSAVGTVAWANPNNAKVSDGVFAGTWSMSSTYQYTHYLKATNFGFSIPAGATINGIVAEIQRYDDTQYTYDDNVAIVKNGVVGATNKALVAAWGSSNSYFTYGSSSDLWGESLTPTDINNSNFGIVLSIKFNDDSNGMIGNNIYVDHIRITVYYTTVYYTVVQDVIQSGIIAFPR